MRQVKIVATIGPANCSSEKQEALMDAGMNVSWFDMSHGTTTWHKSTIQHLRHVSLKKQTTLAILIDLAGPKIFVGDLPKEGRPFIPDQKVSLWSFNDR